MAIIGAFSGRNCAMRRPFASSSPFGVSRYTLAGRPDPTGPPSQPSEVSRCSSASGPDFDTPHLSLRLVPPQWSREMRANC